jgi:hypothetical protein
LVSRCHKHQQVLQRQAQLRVVQAMAQVQAQVQIL